MRTMQSFEVEIKSLLGSEERAEALRQQMKRLDPECKLLDRNSQLNHYFTEGNLEALAESLRFECLSKEKCDELVLLAKQAKDFSVRTREKDGTALIVVKASVDDTLPAGEAGTSHNGISRIEFEEEVKLPLGTLDAVVLGSGFTYQAKWSRLREEYVCRGINVCLDKNAGYGWLAEFERMVDEKDKVDAARQEIRALMRELGAEELPQDRLERMFAFYNAHWQEYYGTDKTFTIA